MFQVASSLFKIDVEGMRPFGVGFLYAGWDTHFGFQLYNSDPSGNDFHFNLLLSAHPPFSVS